MTWIQIDIELNIGIDDALRQAQFLASLVIGEERRDHQRWEEPTPTDGCSEVGNFSEQVWGNPRERGQLAALTFFSPDLLIEFPHL